MKYFMTDNQVIHEEEKLQDGVWVRMISPTQEECEEIADVLNVDIDDIKAALDEEESSVSSCRTIYADSGGRSDDRDPAR